MRGAAVTQRLRVFVSALLLPFALSLSKCLHRGGEGFDKPERELDVRGASRTRVFARPRSDVLQRQKRALPMKNERFSYENTFSTLHTRSTIRSARSLEKREFMRLSPGPAHQQLT